MLANLQAVRAAAALMVVGHHLRTMLEPHVPGIMSLSVGAAGVDLFFVLSGVVIALSLAERPVSAGTFFWHRCLRVVPLWWLALAMLLAMMLSGLAPLGVSPADMTVENFLRSMVFLPFERSHGAIMPLIGVGWTLNYELFFYAIVAVGLVLPIALRIPAVIFAIGALVLAGAWLEPQSVAGRFYTQPILMEFVAGFVLGQIWVRHDAALAAMPSWFGRVLGLLLLTGGLIGLGLAAHPEGYGELMPDRVLIWGGPALAIVAGAMLLERGGLRASASCVMLLGASSYALYLFHPFVLQGIARLAKVSELGPPMAIGVAFFALGLSQAFAIVVHLHLERPMTLWLRCASAAPARRVEPLAVSR